MNKKLHLEHWQIIAVYLVIYDAITINASYLLGLWLRFDMQYSMIPSDLMHTFLRFAPLYTVVCIFVFKKLHLYNSLWRYASFSELNHIVVAWILTVGFHTVGISLFHRMPISYYVIGAIFQLGFTSLIRFSYRYVNLIRKGRQKNSGAKQVMVIGAGEAGRSIIREIKISDKLNAEVACVIDDNPNKWHRQIEGVQIVGGREEILKAAKEYNIDEIMLVIPTATASQKRDILAVCKETDCELKSLPGIYQLANGDVSLSKMKPVAIEDLLGRDPIKADMTEIFKYISGKVILVTGGGGSIGSELCRQIAAHKPKQLIIFDVYENNAYDIEQELKRKYGNGLNLVVLIGSVRDSRRIDMVFKEYRPQLVLHAAAHKHVPLMETSPCEAIKNNAIGTYKTAYAALKYGAERFLLISTDKAVNPTNIMGASKRLCEMIIQSMDAVSRTGRLDLLPAIQAHGDDDFVKREIRESVPKIKLESVSNKNRTGTQFVAVRFGNVLGSNGSVIPLFKKQIEAGGPVTVTHPDIVRYFMTIPEAVSLVLEAATFAWGGEIMVLDMGQAVKIDDLARNLIRLSGYVPDEDIKIEYSGLRLGEKLYEEKLMAEEGLKKTENDLIHIAKPIEFDVESFFKQLEGLAEKSYANDSQIISSVENVVTTFHPVGKNPVLQHEVLK